MDTKKENRKIDKSVIKWVATFSVTLLAILGLWRMTGRALGNTDGAGGESGATPTPVMGATDTPIPTEAPTGTPSVIPTGTPALTPTVTQSVTPTVTLSVTPTATPSVTPTVTPGDAPEATPTATPSITPTVTLTATPTLSPSPSATGTPTPTQTPEATPALAIKEIVATYIGEDRIVSNAVIKTDIEAYIIYTWDSIEPERIPAASLILQPGIVEKEGENIIEVWYDDYKTTISVTGLPRKLVAFEAKYVGGPVYTGTEVDRSYIKAVATYNDNIREDVFDYELLTKKINNQGINSLKIMYGGFLDTIYVDAVVEEENLFKDYPIDSESTTRLTMLVSNEPYANSIYVKTLDPIIVKNAVDRVVTTEKYIGFEVQYLDPEAINEFPIYARIIRPDGYDPDKFGVYYTPNRKTVMAKVDGYYLDEEKKQYVFHIYEPGTYVMLEEISHKLVTSINVEKTFIKMKLNRNVSMLPVVLPESADNTDVTYMSTDPLVATVTKNGKVTSVGVGECDIIISACDESGISVSVHIQVVE